MKDVHYLCVFFVVLTRYFYSWKCKKNGFFIVRNIKISLILHFEI